LAHCMVVSANIQMIVRCKQTILAAALVMAISSCASKVTVQPATEDVRVNRLCSVREGMTESQVSELIGQPEEIRFNGETGIVGEAYRWVYGVKSKGKFPRIGAVIFRENHTVFASYCPTRPFPSLPSISFSESPQSTPSGMCCTVDKVFRNPSLYDIRYIRVSLRNNGTTKYQYTNDHTGIRFSLFLEVYDARKVLVLREPLFAYHSPYSISRSEWPVFQVPAGAWKSEDVPIWWRSEADGTLPHGTYYLRVAGPFEEKRFFGSNLAKWEFTRGSSPYPVWELPRGASAYEKR
jgi:hypothetical protein